MRSNLNIVISSHPQKNYTQNKIDKECIYLFEGGIIILMVNHVNDVKSLKMKRVEKPELP